MHRFFLLDQSINVGKSVDLEPISHQLHSVLRVQPGDVIGLLDGQGHLYETEILSLDRKRGRGQVLKKSTLDTEPLTELTLYQCSLKADKFEWVLQKGTELGVSRFVPVISERSIVRPADALLKKYPRWQKIIQEAAEQSGRGRLPTLDPPMSFKQAIEGATAADHGLKILPWEAAKMGDAAAAVNAILPMESGTTTYKQVWLLIGPEGGLSQSEVDAARAVGWDIASLGPRILRAETAAIAAVAIIINRLG